jgi:16S rRNA (uracil1498-N3)-methyltransferase
MPRLHVPSEELTGAEVTLGGEAHRYLTRVLRLAAGASVELFDGRGQEITATVVRAGPRELTLALGDRRRVAPRATPPVTLLQGLPRPERMDLIVQKATELGAARIVPVRAARSAAGQQPRPDRWERIAREAARQCGRAELPELAAASSLADAVAALAPETTRLVPWEDAPGAAPLHQLLPPHPTGVAILVGPEGGLTPEEIALCLGAGFRIATLGPRILRTETAAIAVLAVIQSLVGGLG